MVQNILALPYLTYTQFLKKHFPHRMQKLPVDAGCGCPVRDGSKGRGGCAFCNAISFAPPCSKNSTDIVKQLEEGKKFFAHKNKTAEEVGFLAYFQSGTNTYPPVEQMRPLIEAALSVEKVEGVVLATRPDCLTEDWLCYLKDLKHRTFMMIELGVESVNDEVLLRMGRGHTLSDVKEAVAKLKEIGIPICAHLIIGLPSEAEDAPIHQAECMNELGVDVVKLHQLQILKGSRLAASYAQHPEQVHPLTLEEYCQKAAAFVRALHHDIAIERFVSQSPASQLIAPKWGVKNDTVTLGILKELERKANTNQTEQKSRNNQ